MKRATVAVALLLLVLIVFGPRPHLDTRRVPSPRPWPSELHRLTSELSSRQPPGVTDGAEARIVWTSSASPTRTSASLLYLHGFSATRQELAPLPERVAHRLGFNLVEGRFTGHGLDGDALAGATAELWLRDTMELLELAQRVGERVVVLGSSTGCSLATVALFESSVKPAAMVFFSPNFGVASSAGKLLGLPWSKFWIPWVAGSERTWTPENEGQARYWTHRYPIEALFPMTAALEAAAQAPVESTDVPLFVAYHPSDPVVSVTQMQAVFSRWGTVEKHIEPVTGPGDRHVLAGDILAPERTEALTEHIADWLGAQVQ